MYFYDGKPEYYGAGVNPEDAVNGRSSLGRFGGGQSCNFERLSHKLPQSAPNQQII